MARSELISTVLDHEELKESLINYLKTKETFEDFDYEGSAINTLVDLLVRNGVYAAFNANMVSNESFIESAQIRGNVASHAQKLSYTPRSKTSSRLTCDITVTPSSPPTEFVITEQPGLVFISSSDGQTYRFTTNDEYSFSYNQTDGKFHASNVELYQGQFIQRNYQYNGEVITIDNQDADMSTLQVYVNEEVLLRYNQATSITEVGVEENVFFLRENSSGNFEVSFGKDVLGREPSVGSIITVRYINSYQPHAIGIKNLIAASSIGDYSNIQVTVTQPSYGGMDRESIDSIRFMAPRVYQAQDRALSPFDYVYLVKKQFPFIRSVISWGGEDNNPPRYGNVMISIVPDVGIQITDSLKTRIENAIREKGVGSVTPLVIEPIIFNADIDVEYKIVRPLLNTSRSALESRIKQFIATYSNQYLYEFDAYFNESDLIEELMKANKELETVVLSEEYRTTLRSYRNLETYYEVNFDNEIEPDTLEIENFQVIFDASSETIKDDGNGSIVHTYVRNGVTRTSTIGTVNYSTGYVQFTTTFIHENELIDVRAKIEGQNFYVRNNNVVRIRNVTTSEIKR